MPKAVIYCRVSSAEQVDNTSLATQETACRDWCRGNGLDVAGVYVDRGESAKTADRPEFLRMVADCQRRLDIERVVVYRVDRFARNTLDHVVYAQRLRKSGAVLASVTEALTEGPGGDFIQNIYAAVAQFDNDVRSCRASDAMKAIRAKGGWVHRPPYGFKIVRREDRVPVLEPDPALVPIIRRAFAMVAAGERPKDVYNKLRPDVSRTRWYAMLKNPIYARIAPKAFKEHKESMPNITRSSPKAGEFPLRGVIICADCGRPVTSSYAKGRYAYYHCKRPSHARISADKIDLAIRGLLADMSGAFMLAWPGIKEYMVRAAAEKVGEAQDRMIAIDTKTRRIEAQLERLIDAMLDGKIPMDQYDKRRAGIEADIALLRQERDELGKQEDDTVALVELAEKVIGDLAMLWNAVNYDLRHKMIRQLFPRGIEIQKGTVRTSVSDSIFGILGASDSGHFRMATPTAWWSNVVEIIKMVA